MKYLIQLIALLAVAALPSALDAQVEKSKEKQGKIVQTVKPGSVDVNTATAAELEKSLKGIGPKKAAAIVAYRKRHGAFRTTDDLLKVAGIAKATVAANLKALKLPAGKIDLSTEKKSTTDKADASGKKGKAGTTDKEKKKGTTEKDKGKEKTKEKPKGTDDPKRKK